jgi:hypothetical protein
MNLVPENIYHKLYRTPITERENSFYEIEAIAEALVGLGLLRISAAERVNFVHLPVQGGEKYITFSKRELIDKNLLKETKQKIAEYLTPTERSEGAEDAIKRKINALTREVTKSVQVSDELEMKIARLVVQMGHPAVLWNMIFERVCVFVSFSYTISELLNLENWQSGKNNNGMQSTNFVDTAVFVSAGGDPFVDPKESQNPDDGFNALSRMMVVGAQEIGHYADIKKDINGNISSRFSSEISMRRPKRECEEARQKDIQHAKNILSKIKKFGLYNVYNLEEKIALQSKYRKFSLQILWWRILKNLMLAIFATRAMTSGIAFFQEFEGERISKDILSCVLDMQFNLEPQADAYRHPNKQVETAIACAEALARVPQQVVKWGHKATSFMVPHLYKIYYREVIPAAIKNYQKISRKKFKLTYTKVKTPFWRRK